MAIPIARVHLKMAHAALPGLLPKPVPKCVAALLPAPRRAAILPGSPLLKPSRADAAERWDAHKIKPDGSPASSSSSCGQRSSVDSKSSSPGNASSCERWDSNKKSVASFSASAATTSILGSSSRRADSQERWDAHKKPVIPVLLPSSSASSSNKWRSKTRASKNSAHKKDANGKRADEHDDGESSTASNDMEVVVQLPTLLPPAFFAGPGFIASPEPSMLPMPTSFMIRVA